MGRVFHINLEIFPWPVSILKFNQAVSEMRTGDQLIALLNDAEVIANLLQLLHHEPDLRVTTAVSQGDWRIEIKKRAGAIHRITPADNQK